MRTIMKLLENLVGSGSGVDLLGYLQSLGALLLMDGTLTDDETKIKNLGSVGAALDATPTAITIDANGMNFNGTTSVLTVPNHASINALTEHTYLFVFNATNSGENSNGAFFAWENGPNRFILNTLPNILAISANYNTTDPTISSTNAGVSAGTAYAFFLNYSESVDRRGRLYRADNIGLTNASVTLVATSSASVGTLTAETQPLRIGNRTAADWTFNGWMSMVGIVGRVLTTDEMTQIAKRA